MVVEFRRYLGDTLGGEIHDADNEREDCRLGEIATDHRRWYDSLREAVADVSYRRCPWCLGGRDGRVREVVATVTGTSKG